VDHHLSEMLLRIDETILSVDPEIEIQEKRHLNEI
jgi:hypothetical protein